MLLRHCLVGLGLTMCATGCFVTVEDDSYSYSLAYAPCYDDGECDGRDFCAWHELSYPDPYDSRRTVVVEDGICTHGCGSDAQCPDSPVSGLQGACYDIGYGLLCYERCFDDYDCPSGFYCVSTVGGVTGDAICLPQ